MSRSRWWWPGAVLAGVLALVQLGAVGAPWRRAFGGAETEAPGHLWGLWSVAAELWRAGPFVRDAELGFPDGFRAHLIDPVNLAAFLPVSLGGGVGWATLGWNLLHLGWLLAGGAGMLALVSASARRGWVPEGGRAAAGLVGVASVVASPFVLAWPWTGRSEYLPAMALPGVLAVLVGFGGRRAVGVAALGVAALGGSGPYLALFALAVLLPVGLCCRSKRTLAVGALGLVGALPSLLALLVDPPTGVDVLAAPAVLPDASGTDLRTLVRLVRAPDLGRALDQPCYLGVVPLGLAFLGLAGRGHRVVAGLLVLAGGLGVLGLGPVGVLGAHRLSMPASWPMDLWSPLGHVHGWSRVAAVLPAVLGWAAALGAGQLASRPALGWGLAALVLVDQGSYPRTWSPAPSFSAEAAEGLDEVLTGIDGALLTLPLEVSVTAGVPLMAGRHALWHQQHGRPVSATPGVVSDATLSSSYLARLVVNRQFGLAFEALGRDVPPQLPFADADAADHLSCVAADLGSLAEQGFGAVVLATDRAPGAELAEELVPLLGEPRVGEGVVAWPVAGRGETCAPPAVHPKVIFMLDRR